MNVRVKSFEDERKKKFSNQSLLEGCLIAEFLLNPGIQIGHQPFLNILVAGSEKDYRIVASGRIISKWRCNFRT